MITLHNSVVAMQLSNCVYPKMQDAENNIECDSPEATVLKLIKSHV